MSVKEKQDTWFAVINVFAASKKAYSKWKKAEALMKEKSIVYHGSTTGKSGNAFELTFDACHAGYRRFIAVGGDGTVHDVLNGIATYIDYCRETGLPIGFDDFTLSAIPVGSGNDWIKSTGGSHDVRKAVDVIFSEKFSCQDVVKVSLLNPESESQPLSVTYMANVGGIGLDAKVCKRVNRLKKAGKRGKILYVTSLLRAIRSRVPLSAKVYADGNLIYDGAYLSIAFGIGKYSGGGMRQTPEAIMDDGLLDMTIIPDISIWKIAREVFRLFNGTFLKVPELVSYKGKAIEVQPYCDANKTIVEVDGEIVGKIPVRFNVQNTKIKISIP